MSEVNLFLIAATCAFRFPSVRGDLTTEQLFDLPLTSRNGFNLDEVAKEINAELKAAGEESFVVPNANSARRLELERKLEIVKFVIADKQAKAAAAASRAEKADKRRKILDALETKENQELTQASKDDLLKQLAELDEVA